MYPQIILFVIKLLWFTLKSCYINSNKTAAPNAVHSFGDHINFYENHLEEVKWEILEENDIKLKNIKLKVIAEYESGDIIKSKEGKNFELGKDELINCNMLPLFK